MKTKTIVSVVTKICIIGLIVAGSIFGIILLLSVFKSGFGYQFDGDELYHTQMAYLYARGFRPYLDVYASVHPAVFQWLLIPVFWIKGFSVQTLYGERLFMIFLLIVRLICAWLMIKMLFSKRAAFLFLFLFLFDPFAVVTMMQIRPDNLMLTLYTAGLFFFTIAMMRNKKFFPVAGILLGSAFVVFPKIAPSLLVLGLIFFFYCISKRKMKELFVIVFYGMIPAFLYCLYLLSIGSFQEMLVQTFPESALLYSNYTYQVPINTLMRPDNVWIFGTMGKPITWVYLWLIVPMGLTGVYYTFQTILRKPVQTAADTTKIIIAVTFLVQWATLFTVQVAFMQHYLPLNWLGALFGAYAIDELLTVAKPHRIAYILLVVLVLLTFGVLTQKSVEYNLSRSTISGEDRLASLEMRWKQIPPDQAVFPGYLFRPSVYPVPYGEFLGDIPQVILNRLPNIIDVLKTKNPMVIIDDYTIDHLPSDIALYIHEHYTRVTGDNELMVRNE